MQTLELDSFRAKPSGTRRPKIPPPRRKKGEWFLKGPIPGTWLHRAAKLPGRALHVGLALWFLAGLKKCNYVTLTWATFNRFGVSPDSGRRGLAALERVGLVSVERHPGRCPRVTILESPIEEGGSGDEGKGQTRGSTKKDENSPRRS